MPITRSTFKVEVVSGAANDWRDGIAGLFFDTPRTSQNDFVEIHAVRIRPRGGNYLASTADLPALALRRIGGFVGGQVVTAAVRDTSEGSPPSQVQMVSLPDRVTGLGDEFRRLRLSTGLAGPTGGGMQTRTYNGAGARVGTSTVFSRRTSGGVLDPIRLAEGQGLALTMPVVRLPMKLDYSVTVRYLSTGATYVYDFAAGTPNTDGEALWALVNGSGSGVSLAVDVVHAPISRRNNYLTAGTDKNLRLAVFEGRRTAVGSFPLSGQEPLGTSVPMDTTKPAAPGVQVLDGAFLSKLIGERFNVQGLDWYTTQASSIANQQRLGVLRRWPLFVPEVNATVQQPLGAWIERSLNTGIRGRGVTPVTLRPGYGLAVLAGSEGAIAGDAAQWYVVEMQYTYHDVDASGGGGVFPAVGDVDSGVIYGPTSNLTGTLVQPVVGDVRLGTSYGAGGTEFTGTLAGGGGGDGMSRARVVNKGT